MATPPHLRLDRADGLPEDAESRTARLTTALSDTEEVLRLLEHAQRVAERKLTADAHHRGAWVLRINRLQRHHQAFLQRRAALQTELLDLRLSEVLQPGGFWAIDGRRA